MDEGTKVDEKVDEGTNRSSCPFGLDDWFANHESINIREAMELFGLSKSGANKRLNALVSDNLLEMQGKGKGARYVPKRPSTWLASANIRQCRTNIFYDSYYDSYYDDEKIWANAYRVKAQ